MTSSPITGPDGAGRHGQGASGPGAPAGLPAGPPGDLLEELCLALAAVREGARLALEPGEALRIDTKRDRNDVVTQVDRAVETLIAERLAPTGHALVGEEGHAAGSWAGRVWVLDPIDGTLNYVAAHRHWAISLALVDDGRPLLGIVADPVDDRLYVGLAGGGAWSGRLLGARPDGGAPLIPDSPGGAGPLEGLGRLAPLPDTALADGLVIAQFSAIRALSRLPTALEASRGMRCYGAAAIELAEVAAGRAGCLVHLRLQPWDVSAGVLLCQETGAVVTRLDGTRLDVREPGSLLVGAPTAHAEMLARLAGY